MRAAKTFAAMEDAWRRFLNPDPYPDVPCSLCGKLTPRTWIYLTTGEWVCQGCLASQVRKVLSGG